MRRQYTILVVPKNISHVCFSKEMIEIVSTIPRIVVQKALIVYRKLSTMVLVLQRGAHCSSYIAVVDIMVCSSERV